MTTQQNNPSLREALAIFVRAMLAANKSQATISAYSTDVVQCINWLEENNCTVTTVDQVTKADITEYLASLGQTGISGTARARKLAAIRAYFRHLVTLEVLSKSPTDGIPTPKKEGNTRNILTKQEYLQLLAIAGGNPRDYAIMQVFLQTGLRISELCNLHLSDVSLTERLLLVRQGKGRQDRPIGLDKKVLQALKNYLAIRPQSPYPHLFLNRDNQPFSRQGIDKLVKKYIKLAGITKKVSSHNLRHTCATHKRRLGMDVFQLKAMLGHKRLDTTQIYVHMEHEDTLRAMEATSL